MMYKLFHPQKEARPMPGEEFLKLIPAFHTTQLWRPIIDGYRQDEGPFVFDTGEKGEPQYLMDMFKGLDFIARTRDEPVTCDYIEILHDLCITNVKTAIEKHNKEYEQKNMELNNSTKVIDIDPPKPVPELNYRNNIKVQFGIISTAAKSLQNQPERANLSEEGFAELIAFIKKINTKYSAEILSININKSESSTINMAPINLDTIQFNGIQTLIQQGEKIVVTSASMEKDLIKLIITDLINEFQEKLKSSNNEADKISATASFIQQLEVLHPFTDANCRTFCVLLLNKILLQNKLSPVILLNPNRFDAFSNKELTSDIYNGQKKFQQYENYNQCNDIVNSIKNGIKKKELNLIFSGNIFTQLRQIEQLELIDHVYHRLVIDKPKNYKDYLPSLEKRYKETLSMMDGSLSNADLRRFKYATAIHCLGEKCHDEINNLNSKSSKVERKF